MGKTILMVLLAVVSRSAAAGWEFVGTTATSTVYADRMTIRKEGNKVKMWSLDDLKSVRQNSFNERHLSTMGRNEYDCEQELLRPIALSVYTGAKGSGDQIFAHADVGSWAAVAPGTTAESLWKVACGKK